MRIRVFRSALSKLNKDTTQKDSHRWIRFMNTDASILDKLSATWKKSISKKYINTNDIYLRSKNLSQLRKIKVIHCINTLKKNYLIIISIDAKNKKSIWEVHSWQKVSTNYIKRNPRKGTYKNPTNLISFFMVKDWMFPPKISKNRRIPILRNTESFSQCNNVYIKKGIKTGKECEKFNLFIDDKQMTWSWLSM